MHPEMKEYYRLYRLDRVYDPFIKDWKNTDGIWGAKEPGLCRLEFLGEAESVEALMDEMPPKRMYYTGGQEKVERFRIDGRYEFVMMEMKAGADYGIYRTQKPSIGCTNGFKSFKRIYEARTGDILLIASTWNSSQMKEGEIWFQNKTEFMLYKLEICE